MGESDINENITWNDKLEEYFASTGEKAHCLSWLHKKAESLYSNRSTFIDLPVIILSALIGGTSIGSKSLFGESEAAPMVLGLVSIFVGILNTVGTYFSWSRRAEAHRISNIQYSRLYRHISVEMALPRNERTKPAELLQFIRTEYDRLNEISPLIPPRIIKEFNARFSEEKEISQPEETNGLEKITVYSPPKIDSPTQTVEEKKEEPIIEPPLPLNPSIVLEVVDTAVKKPKPFKP
jgi:hypothetical protein